jgi:hypothetical protein
MFGYCKESYGVFDNHSRDRHGSIFDGAEWDGMSSGTAWQCKPSLCEFWPVVLVFSWCLAG